MFGILRKFETYNFATLSMNTFLRPKTCLWYGKENCTICIEFVYLESLANQAVQATVV